MFNACHVGLVARPAGGGNFIDKINKLPMLIEYFQLLSSKLSMSRVVLIEKVSLDERWKRQFDWKLRNDSSRHRKVNEDQVYIWKSCSIKLFSERSLSSRWSLCAFPSQTVWQHDWALRTSEWAENLSFWLKFSLEKVIRSKLLRSTSIKKRNVCP